jgi:hypothetical protein
MVSGVPGIDDTGHNPDALSVAIDPIDEDLADVGVRRHG